MKQAFELTEKSGYWLGLFQCMASPCEVLIEAVDQAEATRLLTLAEVEARRIEKKFSRYLEGNVVHGLNNSNGSPVVVDDETRKLLDFADQCYSLSNGLFDITSGVLRRVWKFDGSDRIPSEKSIKSILAFVSWDKVKRDVDSITLEPGMEIDFGGIGKEYATDRVASILRQASEQSILVNFGGDLCITRPRQGKNPWLVGIEDPSQKCGDTRVIEIIHGAVATSGDSKRFLLKGGQRYSHILNPITGWPVHGAPASVTVVAKSCLEAGMLSTLASLRGNDAEIFLDAHCELYWCFR